MNSHLQDELDSLEQNSTILRNERNQLQVENHDLKERLDDIEMENRMLRTTADRQRNELEVLNKGRQPDSWRDALMKTNDRLSAENSSLRTKINRLHSDISILKGRLESETPSALRKQIERYRAEGFEHAGIINKQSVELAAIKREIDHFKRGADYKKHEHEIKSLRNQLLMHKELLNSTYAYCSATSKDDDIEQLRRKLNYQKGRYTWHKKRLTRLLDSLGCNAVDPEVDGYVPTYVEIENAIADLKERTIRPLHKNDGELVALREQRSMLTKRLQDALVQLGGVEMVLKGVNDENV